MLWSERNDMSQNGVESDVQKKRGT